MNLSGLQPGSISGPKSPAKSLGPAKKSNSSSVDTSPESTDRVDVTVPKELPRSGEQSSPKVQTEAKSPATGKPQETSPLPLERADFRALGYLAHATGSLLSGVGVQLGGNLAARDLKRVALSATRPENDQQTRSAQFQLLETALRDPDAKVTKEARLKGGLNSATMLKLDNGATGVWKRSYGENRTKMRDNLEENHQGPRELAAYVVDKAMGHLGGVPPAVKRSFEGSDGTLLYMMPDTKVAVHSHKTLSSKSVGYRRIAILDNVIGNLDRHGGNWMYTSEDNPVPIDHGLSFPLKNGDQGGANFEFGAKVELNEGETLALTGLLMNRQEVSKQLKPLLDKRAIDAMFERVGTMLERGSTYSEWRTGD